MTKPPVPVYALEHRERSLSNALRRAANSELKRFNRGLTILDTLITLAPLLGLLGTVTGMIHAFGLIGGELDAPTALTNLTNTNTRRAYRNEVGSFMRFVGINSPPEVRSVRRAHVIAWRKQLEKGKFAAATVRRKLAALSDLFNYLCEKNVSVIPKLIV